MTKDEWYDNLEVINQLTLDNLVRVKAPNGKYLNINAMNGMTSEDDPILWLGGSLGTDNDVFVCGSITSTTDFASGKQSGGGALLISHGWLGSGTQANPIALSPPLLKLTTSETQIKRGPTLPSANDMTDQAGQIFYRTSNNILYIWTGSSWVPYESNSSGYYDTLFLFKNDCYNPANLDLGDLIAHGYVHVNDLSPILEQDWIDVHAKLRINGDLQLVDGKVASSLNPVTAGLALGSPTEPWDGVVALNGYFDALYFSKLDPDVKLYRGAQNVLKTDDSFYFGTSLADGYLNSQCSGPLRFKHTSGQTMYIRPDENGTIVFFENPPAGPQSIYIKTLAANAGATLRNSSSLAFVGKYWTGSATADSYASIVHAMLSTSPTSEILFQINGTRLGSLDNSGYLWLGSTKDTNLYRGSAGVLQTDACVKINHTGANVTFYDINLYRQTSPSVALELSSSMIIDGSLQVGSGLSVTGVIGATGNITANGSVTASSITCPGLIHGGGYSGNAFKIGDDCYLVDINQADTIGVQGAYNSNIGGLRLGNSTWTQFKNSGAILYFQTYTTTGGILPSTGGYYTLGSSSNDWSYVYANYLRYDVNCVEYDALDDLALVKSHKSKKIIDKQSGEEITVIDMKESFPFLLADDNHIAHEKLQGYMLGCVKALVLRVEALENQLKQNQTVA